MLLIIRSAGERTELFYKQHQYLQANFDIKYVSEKPFLLTLKKSLELALDYSHKSQEIFACVDADALIQQDNFILFSKKMKNLSPLFFGGHGKVIDKFFPYPREAGIHFYRYSHLEKMLMAIPQQDELRPEGKMIQNMQDKGFRYERSNLILGLHDYEQNYQDIFSKFMLHSRKHLYKADELLTRWNTYRDQDLDFEVAIRGFAAGLITKEKVYCDRNELNQKLYEKYCNEVEEKEKIQDWKKIEDLINSTIFLGMNYHKKNTWKQIIKETIKRISRI